jgi:hypothetical protein
MPAKNPWQHDVVHLVNKGLDIIHPIEQVDAEHYSRMNNVKSLQEGTITPRPGTTILNATTFDIAKFAAGTESETEHGCGTGNVGVTSGAGDGVYGSYVTVIASTVRISKFWVFTVVHGSGLPDTSNTTGIDISFDAGAGPEVNFIEGHTIHFERRTTSPLSTGDTFEFPFEIPAGSRIRIRIEDSNVSTFVYGFTASMVG